MNGTTKILPTVTTPVISKIFKMNASTSTNDPLLSFVYSRLNAEAMESCETMLVRTRMTPEIPKAKVKLPKSSGRKRRAIKILPIPCINVPTRFPICRTAAFLRKRPLPKSSRCLEIIFIIQALYLKQSHYQSCNLKLIRIY